MVEFSGNPIVEIEAMYGSAVKLELVRIDGVAALSLTPEHYTGHRTTVFLSAKQTAQMLDWILTGTEPE